MEKFKKKAKILLIITAILIVALIALNIISAFTGYRGLLRKVTNAYEEYDIDTLVYLSSDVYYYGAEDYVDSYFESRVGSGLDTFEASVGHDFSLSFETTDSYNLSKRKKEGVLDALEAAYPDFDTDAIKQVRVAEVMVTAKQGKRSLNRNLTITMTKENGEWKLLYIE